ncbi:uncharacterized protein LOC141902007 [Tubulanus polymorphus]|uniref:uncharacterized protein LOC141902007 n=1 Tax=Tubulanus polymorphus TaxID=672921 RepID=UPI003DA66753
MMSMQSVLADRLTHYEKSLRNAKSIYRDSEKCLEELGARLLSAENVCEAIFVDSTKINDCFMMKPIILVAGRVNCGKSSLLNTLFRDIILPVKDIPCTARVVRVVQVSKEEREYLCFIDQQGFKKDIEYVENRQTISESKKIALTEEERNQDNEVLQVVEVGLHHSLLAAGLTLLDCPGLDENNTLDSRVESLLKEGHITTVIYVINGNEGFRESDEKNLEKIQGMVPSCPIIYVCNKLDTDRIAKKMDQASDDEGGENEGTSPEQQKINTFKDLKKRKFLRESDTLESCKRYYHGISSLRAMKAFQKKMKSKSKPKRRKSDTDAVKTLPKKISRRYKSEDRDKYMENFEAFEEALVEVVFANLNERLCEGVRLIENQLTIMMTILKNDLGRNENEDGDDDALSLWVAQAMSAGDDWCTNLRDVIAGVSIIDQIQNNLSCMKSDLVGEVEINRNCSLNQDHKDSEKAIAKGALSELKVKDMRVKCAYMKSIKTKITNYVFNCLKYSIQEEFEKSLNNMALAVVGSLEILEPLIASVISSSYRASVKRGVYDVDKVLQCKTIVCESASVILDSIYEQLRIKIESICPNSVMEEILQANEFKMSRCWKIMFIETYIQSIVPADLAEIINTTTQTQLIQMKNTYQTTLDAVSNLSKDVRQQTTDSVTQLINQFEGTIAKLIFQTQDIYTCKDYFDIENHFMEVAPPFITGKLNRIYLVDDCYKNGLGKHFVVKEIPLNDNNKLQIHLTSISNIPPHGNILSLYGIKTTSSVCYLIEERGRDRLDKVLNIEVPLERRLIQWGTEIAEVLLHLLRNGYVYSDLKLENIMIVGNRAKLNLMKLPDFLNTTTPVFHISPDLYDKLQISTTFPSPIGQESDVLFAYAMLLYNLIVGSPMVPQVYANCSSSDCVIDNMKKGLYPDTTELPSIVPETLRLMLKECWVGGRACTVTIQELKNILQTISNLEQ